MTASSDGRMAMGLDPDKLNILQVPVPSLAKFDPTSINDRLRAAKENPTGSAAMLWYRTDVSVLMGLLGKVLEANTILESTLQAVELTHGLTNDALRSAVVSALRAAEEALE